MVHSAHSTQAQGPLIWAGEFSNISDGCNLQPGLRIRVFISCSQHFECPFPCGMGEELPSKPSSLQLPRCAQITRSGSIPSPDYNEVIVRCLLSKPGTTRVNQCPLHSPPHTELSAPLSDCFVGAGGGSQLTRKLLGPGVEEHLMCSSPRGTKKPHCPVTVHL